MEVKCKDPTCSSHGTCIKGTCHCEERMRIKHVNAFHVFPRPFETWADDLSLGNRSRLLSGGLEFTQLWGAHWHLLSGLPAWGLQCDHPQLRL